MFILLQMPATHLLTCYHCAYGFDAHSKMLAHITAKHRHLEYETQHHALNAKDGTLHIVTPLQIEEKGERLIFDKSKN